MVERSGGGPAVRDLESESARDLGEDYVELDFRRYQLLEKWQYLAVLFLATCAAFRLYPVWNSGRLRLQVEDAAEAIAVLLRHKALVVEGDQVRIAKNRIRLRPNPPTPASRHAKYARRSRRRRSSSPARTRSPITTGG